MEGGVGEEEGEAPLVGQGLQWDMKLANMIGPVHKALGLRPWEAVRAARLLC